MPRPSSKEDLLTHGAAVIHARGYHATGVAEIAAAAGVPKGSFYNHFESKEAFADVILGRYFDGFTAELESAIEQAPVAGGARLRVMIDGMVTALSGDAWSGCLLGNFALEVCAHSEPLRHKIDGYFERWRRDVRHVIAEGQSDGSIDAKLAPDDMAGLFVSAWEGAVLRARVARDPAPLQEFRRAILAQFLT